VDICGCTYAGEPNEERGQDLTRGRGTSTLYM